MSESPVEGENAAGLASATQKPPNTASSVDATAPSVSYRPVCRTAGPPIREILKKIRIETGFRPLVEHHQKRSADRRRAGFRYRRLQNCDLDGFCGSSACYSCNTLPKRINGAGVTSAFWLCREFGLSIVNRAAVEPALANW